MKLKKIVLILLLTLALFSISSVSAQNIDVNTTNNINPLNEVLIDETIATSNELTNKSSIISNDLEKYYKDDKIIKMIKDSALHFIMKMELH